MNFCWHDWVIIEIKTKREVFEDALYKFREDNADYEFLTIFLNRIANEYMSVFYDLKYVIRMCSKCEKIKDEIKEEFDVQYSLIENKFRKFKIDVITREKYYEKHGEKSCNMS